ncbi:YqkE family protein [Calidifontibacillus oryziterrae]|uniref:YqkE family protein n=1 Tax=Calidifontibacillus oryziterrae TaxID=1191699 RepID=UPI00030C00A6|nr:YqkE family protein [Calidifontibacillus oryziterrae]
MAKKKAQKRLSEKNKQNEDNISVLDHLDQNVYAKLKEKQLQLKREADQQKEAEEERKREERRQREKNKSFEELLGESDLDWRKFK